MEKSELKIVYMGTPEFAVAPLEALLKEGYRIAGVVTVPDKPKGRGLQMLPSDVKKFVTAYNEAMSENERIPLLQPEKLRSEEFTEALGRIDADLFIVVAFRMLPEVVWKMPRLGTFNLHGSLLPKYRGAAPINWAIMNGEKESGVTTFFIDEKIDTGRILMQERCAIGPRETVGTLYDRLMETGARLVVRTVEGILSETITPIAQDESTSATPAPKIHKETCAISWDRGAFEIDCQVRGLSPYPGCTAVLRKNTGETADIKIFMTEPAPGAIRGCMPGTVRAAGGRLYVMCGDDSLEITALQMAGKKRMSAADFLRGFHGIEEYGFVVRRADAMSTDDRPTDDRPADDRPADEREGGCGS